MAQRVFIKIVGFADEERHALNLLFRISEEQGTAFALWEPNAPEAPKLALIDSLSYEAQVEIHSPRHGEIPFIWVGANPPPGAWRVFERPIAWPEVVQAMDELFPAPLDFDMELDNVDTQPPDTIPPELPPRRRALIAAADRDERLYLRAKLALADLTQADEAENAADALEMARLNDYVLAIVDFELPGAERWKFLRDLSDGQRPIRKVIVTSASASLIEHVRARFSGVAGLFDKPPHPGKLHQLLREI
jgi:CheY-like chemotaxis protein